MLAYHNNPKVKGDILNQLAKHRAADKIVRGQYWEDGKGCAVGCAIHSDDHRLYAHRFGIPVVLAHAEDFIFEGLPNDIAMEWPMRFMGSINVGADLSMVWPRLGLWLLTNLPRTRETPARTAVATAMTLYREWCETGVEPASYRWIAASDTIRDIACEITNVGSAICSAARRAAIPNDHSRGYAISEGASTAYWEVYDSNLDRFGGYHAAQDDYYARVADKLIELISACPSPLEAGGADVADAVEEREMRNLRRSIIVGVDPEVELAFA